MRVQVARILTQCFLGVFALGCGGAHDEPLAESPDNALSAHASGLRAPLPAPALVAPHWRPPFTIGTAGQSASIELTSAWGGSHVHAHWIDQHAAGLRLMVAKQNTSGHFGAAEQVVQASPNVILRAWHVAVSGNGTPTAVWVLPNQTGPDRVMVSRRNAAGWSAPQQVGSGTQIRSTWIAFDLVGRLAVMFYDQVGATTTVAQFDGSRWLANKRFLSTGPSPLITMHPLTGQVTVVVSDATGNKVADADSRGRWTALSTLPLRGTVQSLQTSMAGHTMLSYLDSATFTDISVLRRTNRSSAWVSHPRVLVGSRSSAVVSDASGDAVLVSDGEPAGAQYRRYNATTNRWGTTSVVLAGRRTVLRAAINPATLATLLIADDRITRRVVHLNGRSQVAARTQLPFTQFAPYHSVSINGAGQSTVAFTTLQATNRLSHYR